MEQTSNLLIQKLHIFLYTLNAECICDSDVFTWVYFHTLDTESSPQFVGAHNLLWTN